MSTTTHDTESTYIVPLDEHGELADANWITYLVVTVASPKSLENVGRIVNRTLRSTRIVMAENDGDIDTTATIAAIKAALGDAGLPDVTVATTTGLAWMASPE